LFGIDLLDNRRMMKRRLDRVLFLTLALAARSAGAEDPPPFRQGMWEFDRSAGPQRMHKTECTNPSEDMKRQNEMMAKAGECKFSAPQRSGSTYTFSAECNMQGPQGQRINFRSTSVMTVESDSAYRIEVTTTGGPGPPGKELLTARRIGDCTK
jgi:hypothetical protein